MQRVAEIAADRERRARAWPRGAGDPFAPVEREADCLAGYRNGADDRRADIETLGAALGTAPGTETDIGACTAELAERMRETCRGIDERFDAVARDRTGLAVRFEADARGYVGRAIAGDHPDRGAAASAVEDEALLSHQPDR